MGHAGPGLGPSCVLGDSSAAAHSHPQLPPSGHLYKPLAPLLQTPLIPKTIGPRSGSCLSLLLLRLGLGGPDLRLEEGQVRQGHRTGLPPDLSHSGKRGVLVGKAPQLGLSRWLRGLLKSSFVLIRGWA